MRRVQLPATSRLSAHPLSSACDNNLSSREIRDSSTLIADCIGSAGTVSSSNKQVDCLKLRLHSLTAVQRAAGA
jgi:hypothetical protein